MSDKKIVMLEENAEEKTATGWCCKSCGRFWGKDNRMAGFCCSTHHLCNCGAMCDRYHSQCNKCSDKERSDKWFSKPEIEWDGCWPIADWGSDKFFFGVEDLEDYLLSYDLEDDADDESVVLRCIDNLWLTSCYPLLPRAASVSEYIFDDVSVCDLPDDSEINKLVDEWAEKNAPKVFYMTGKRLSIRSVKERLGYTK